MKVMITGAGGRLGGDLQRVLSARHELWAVARSGLDVTDADKVHDAVQSYKPDVIVHAAAYTKVDLAETKAAAAYHVNGFGARNIAEAAESEQAKLVYVSTDYVFDGLKGAPYTERDPANPISVYGRSKLLGENFVAACSEKHFIVRTAWLYGRYGDNFVKKMITLARMGRDIHAADDVYGSPTCTLDLARLIGELIDTERYGVYHGAGRGVCSRHEFVQTILDEAGFSHIRAVPVSSDFFQLAAPRPAHSGLDDEAVRAAGIARLRPWQDALRDFIRNDLNEGGDRS